MNLDSPADVFEDDNVSRMGARHFGTWDKGVL